MDRHSLVLVLCIGLHMAILADADKTHPQVQPRIRTMLFAMWTRIPCSLPSKCGNSLALAYGFACESKFAVLGVGLRMMLASAICTPITCLAAVCCEYERIW